MYANPWILHPYGTPEHVIAKHGNYYADIKTATLLESPSTRFLEPGCRYLLQLSLENITELEYWCWAMRPGSQSPIHPRGAGCKAGLSARQSWQLPHDKRERVSEDSVRCVWPESTVPFHRKITQKRSTGGSWDAEHNTVYVMCKSSTCVSVFGCGVNWFFLHFKSLCCVFLVGVWDIFL